MENKIELESVIQQLCNCHALLEVLNENLKVVQDAAECEGKDYNFSALLNVIETTNDKARETLSNLIENLESMEEEEDEEE